MIASVSLFSETTKLQQLSHLAERDQLTKPDRVQLYKIAASCGQGSKSIHGLVYDWWAEFDAALFNGQLHPCLIVIGVTEHSGCLGKCHPVAGQARITLHQALIDPAQTAYDKKLIERGDEPTRWGMPLRFMSEQLLKDVLLHEMQHQAQGDLGLRKIGEDAHNCQSWSDLCNHSAKYLGIADQVFFPHYKRRKTKAIEGKARQNTWVAINKDEAPKGARIASQAETKCFPYVTFDTMGLAEARYGS